MNQTLLTVTTMVQPNSATLLEERIERFRATWETARQGYADLGRKVPTLHFMALMVFRDPHYDPLFLMEVNFDGPELAFWQALETAIGADLVEMLRYCSPAGSAVAPEQFRALCDTGQGLQAVLQALAVRPTASHLGNRGLSCARIRADAALFRDVQAALGDGGAYRAALPADIHCGLRSKVAGQHPWLDERAAPRIPAAERHGDLANLLLFASLALAVLAVPGAALALVLPPWFTALGGVAVAALLMPKLPDLGQLVPNVRLAKLGLVLAAALLALPWLMLGAFALWGIAGLAMLMQGSAPVGIVPWLAGAFWKSLAGVACVPALVLALLRWVRAVEGRDTAQLAPTRDAAALRRISEQEDHVSAVVQNHMGSIVLVKPGVLRSVLLAAGHRALHLIVRATAADGYLSQMRMIHFAHWAKLNNGSRLLFVSNFDGPWDSYLDDFIEKAHSGTTLAWTNCVGSPLARFLMLDGVRQGRQFKAWARRSMAPNLFWFSAYPMLTVNQIERNHAIAEGLRKPALEPGEARQWALML